MPYATVDALPDAVKSGLHMSAQRTWMKVFNSSADAGDDEATCMAKAWAAVKKTYNRLGPQGGLWKNDEAPNMATQGSIDLFLSDTTSSVEIITGENGNLVARGLPVLQVGKWNGKEYTVEDLVAVAANFADIQGADAWEPPMRPYHAYDREGKPVSHSASETLGWHKAMRFDEPTGRLLADVELVDRQTAADMISGKLRYVSSEIARDAYTSPVTGKAYGIAYVGGAFVDNPAVKGMPWQIVTNAAEFWDGDAGTIECFASWGGMSADEIKESVSNAVAPPKSGDMCSAAYVRDMYEDYCIVGDGEKTWKVPFAFDVDGKMTVGTKTEVEETWVPVSGGTAALAADTDTTGLPGNEAGTPGPKGVRHMGLIETLKAKFKALGVKDEDLAELDTLAEKPAEVTPPPATVAPLVDDSLRRQVEQLAQANKEQVATIATLAADARLSKTAATVDGWVSGGKLPPALRVPAFALVDALMASPGGEIDVLAQDAEGKPTTRKASALDLFSEIVVGIAPSIATKPKGAAFVGEVEPVKVVVLSDEQLDAIAAKAGGKSQ